MIHTLMIRLTRFTFVILFSFVAVAVQAQTNAYEEYINKYSDMAVEQMKQYRIPASITLAQGLLESGAGRSTLWPGLERTLSCAGRRLCKRAFQGL